MSKSSWRRDQIRRLRGAGGIRSTGGVIYWDKGYGVASLLVHQIIDSAPVPEQLSP